MAIDTAERRQSAFIDPWAVIVPDGTVQTRDRVTLLGQYSGFVAAAGTVGSPDTVSVSLRINRAETKSLYVQTALVLNQYIERSRSITLER